MTEIRSLIINRVYERLDDKVTGLRNDDNYWHTHFPNKQKVIWKGINSRNYPSSTTPSIHINPEPTTITRKTPHLYEKTFEITLHIYEKGGRGRFDETKYELGDEIIEKVTSAIEVENDRQFQSLVDGVLQDDTEIIGLTSYNKVMEDTFETGENLIFVLIRYEFVYTENRRT